MDGGWNMMGFGYRLYPTYNGWDRYERVVDSHGRTKKESRKRGKAQ